MRSADSTETCGVQVAAFTSMLLIAQQVAGRATRDTLFLSNFRTSYLPLAMASGAVLSLLAAVQLAREMMKRTPASIMPVLFGVSALGFGLEWALSFEAPRAAALLVYFQTATLGPLLISTFWSLINERFDPHTAKRAVARIAGGGALGGVLGGVATWRASSLIQPSTVLLFLTLMNALAVAGTLLTRARRRAAPIAPSPALDPKTSPFSALREMPFLRSVGLLVALGAAISALLDYVFSVEATRSLGTGRPLLSFFSLFWLGVGVLSFLLQISLGRFALEKLGLALNIAILPAIIALGGALGLAVPGLASAAMLRGAEAVQRNTLFRSAYELLYAPVPDSSKRAAKALIDVGCDRLGTIAGSVVALVLLHGLVRGHATGLLFVVVTLALLTLPVTRRLHVGYVHALQQGLREGATRLANGADSGATAVASGGVVATQRQREELTDRVESLQSGGLSAMLDAAGDGAQPPVEPAGVAGGEALLNTASDLLSADSGRVLRGLADLKAHEPAVACAILLLGHPQHYEAAQRALSAQAPRITGQLLDALLEPSTDFAVRRRIPRALRACSTQRAADGLLLGIADDRFEVRYECARALLDVTDKNPQIVISQPRIIDAIRREVESSQRLEAQSSVVAEVDGEVAPGEEQTLLGSLVLDRANRSLDHLCSILSLVLEREPLRMAFNALHHQDDKFRGTALEYLDTVLPSEVREIVWPYIGETAPLPTARPVSELLADLARAAAAGSGTNSGNGP